MTNSTVSTLLTVCICMATTACGGDKQRAAPVVQAVVIQEPAAGRTVVAEINGTPVYDDCVARQRSSGAATNTVAVNECIDFELLAQEAQRKQFHQHPEVVAARKREVVRAFIADQFTKTFNSPAHVPESNIRQVYNRTRARYVHAEWRYAIYVRVDVDMKAPRGGPEDIAAKSVMQELHKALRDKRDLKPDEFKRIAETTSNNRPISLSMKPYAFPLRGRAVVEFADAGFAIPAVGRVSPPTRTKWGWDILLLTKILPAENQTFDQVKQSIAETIFDESRRQAFLRWSHTLSRGKKIHVDDDQFAKLKKPAWMTGARTPPPPQ